MNTFSIYALADGAFTGRTYEGAAEGILDMLRLYPDHGFVLGEHDPLSQRVDVQTGEVIDYQPAQPGPRYVWDGATKRWVYVPGDAEALYHAQQDALERVNRHYAQALSYIRATYPPDEVTSWAKQETEARAYVADSAAPTPLLSAIAEARGVLLALLVEKVIEKADLFAAASGALIGARQHAEDRIDAAMTPAEVAAVMAELLPAV